MTKVLIVDHSSRLSRLGSDVAMKILEFVQCRSVIYPAKIIKAPLHCRAQTESTEHKINIIHGIVDRVTTRLIISTYIWRFANFIENGEILLIDRYHNRYLRETDWRPGQWAFFQAWWRAISGTATNLPLTMTLGKLIKRG